MTINGMERMNSHICSSDFPLSTDFEPKLFGALLSAMPGMPAVKGCLVWLCIHFSSASKYLTLVDQMEDLLSTAVSFHRSGRGREALEVLQKIRENFQAAKRLEPASADAYVAFAQAMLASNNLKESIEAWESALERMNEDKDPSMFAWAKGRLRWARYGVVSMKRDALYANGQGDLVESKKLVEDQLQIYPGFPSRHWLMVSCVV
jgi:tetratricopeptide (TPR) repeat protein